MATNKQKTQKVADNDAATLGYLRKSDLSHKAEIQMLITLAESHGIKMAYNEKDGEVTVERVEPVKESIQTQQSFAQMQRTPNQPPDLSGIDYVRLANALKEPVEKALQNAVESSPVHIQAIFDTSVHMENNQTAMTIAHEEWAKWMQAFGKETISRLPNAPFPTRIPEGKAITFGKDTVYKVPENELDVAPSPPSKEAEKQPTKYRRLHQLRSHVWSDMVTSWWKCLVYTIALCSLVLAAASWYRQSQLEAVVKEYYIIKPVLKQDRKYAPLIHTMDSVILKDGIDEVCERVYGEKR
ncbi:hypothetical protein [Prevotella pectinovora]|uniref:hypothetical protein n=1 Tax=Prevotella pectinovora TaxID=1602169 RepID=UPI003522D2A3